MSQRGLWYDGLVALERRVTVRQGPGGLVLTDEAGNDFQVDPTNLVRMGSQKHQLKLGHRDSEGWRLVLGQPVDPAILAMLPRRAGSLVPGASRHTMALLVGLSAAASALAAVVIFAPEAIAKHMPLSWEKKLAAAYDLPIGAAQCSDQDAQRALNSIVDRLDPEARRDGLTIQLLDLDIPNAAALPGGRMVVLDGLFDDIDNPDAAAGIVAHEIAHVRRRHVAAAMVRELGLGTVITLLGGGAVASNAGGLLSLKFSRSAEAEADADAVAMLQRAGIDPRPTAKAFEQFHKQEGDWPEWLGSHPASGGRAQGFAASYQPGRSYRPVIDTNQSKALLAACRG